MQMLGVIWLCLDSVSTLQVYVLCNFFFSPSQEVVCMVFKAVQSGQMCKNLHLWSSQAPL